MTKIVALLSVACLWVAVCRARLPQVTTREDRPPSTTLRRPVQVSMGTSRIPLLSDEENDDSPGAQVREAERNLRLAKKSAHRELVSARNRFASEVLHNRSVLLRSILKKQRAQEPSAEC